MYGGLPGTLANSMKHGISDTQEVMFAETNKLETWIDAFDREHVRQGGLTCKSLCTRVIVFIANGDADELIKNPASVASAHHSLRVTEPTLCDPSVKQYSGYLDITNGDALLEALSASKHPTPNTS